MVGGVANKFKCVYVRVRTYVRIPSYDIIFKRVVKFYLIRVRVRTFLTSVTSIVRAFDYFIGLLKRRKNNRESMV